MGDNPLLSVVLPAYNESHRLADTLRQALAYLERQDYRSEVVVVDDGSSDGTAAIAGAFADRPVPVRVLRFERNRGKGAAVREGCLAAAGDFVLFMDADHSTRIEEVEGFLPILRDRGYDLAVGVRTFQEGESRMRRIVGLTFLILAHLIVFRKAVVDSQCGFKCFTRATARRIFSHCRTAGGTIDVEVIALAHRMDLRLYYVPVHWHNRPGSRINFLRCVVQDPIDMIRIRLRKYCDLHRDGSRGDAVR